MKILQVSSAMSLGGGETHVIDLCQALIERHHEVHLALRLQSPLRDRLASSSVTFHDVPLRNSLDVGSAQRLSHIIQHQQIDIIHGHVARDYAVCALARRGAGRGQLVLTRHHYLPIKENWGYRWLFRQVGRVISVSEFVRQGLITSLNLPSDQIVTIPNWITPDEYRQLPDPQFARNRFDVHEPFVVGMIGQITPAKGQEEFVRAAGLIASQRDDVAFLIAGQEQDQRTPFTRRLRSLADEAGLGKRLKFIGRVEQLPEFFAALTVFVVPSWQEAFSIVLIQAMAAGVPVIASDIGGPAEIITHGVTGLLVPPRHVEIVAGAINSLLDHPDQQTQLAEAARQEVQRRFERETVINQIESIYQDLVLDSHPSMM